MKYQQQGLCRGHTSQVTINELNETSKQYTFENYTPEN